MKFKATLRIIVLTLLAGLTFGVAACSSQPAPEADDELDGYTLGEPLTDRPEVVAVVESEYGTDTLSAAAFDQRIQRLMQIAPQIMFDPAQAPAVRAGIVDQFVVDHVLRGEASRLNLEATPEQVQEQMAQIRGQFPSDSAYTAFLEQQQLTEDSIRTQVALDLLPRIVLEQMMEDMEDVSDADLQAFAAEQGEQVRAQHILFLVDRDATEVELDSVRTLAEAVLDSATSGVDFGELAERHSQDTQSAVQGGDLGFFSRGDMVPEFEEASFALADSGAVAQDLIRTDYGYHIIRLVERRQEALPQDQARSMLEQQRRMDVQQQGVDKLLAQTTVRVNPDVVDTDLLMPNTER